MLKTHLVRYAALFWGLVVFMPVGVNYLAFFALLACMLAQVGLRERISRLRSHLMWWPAVFYVTWTLLVLAIQPTYPETLSNLWHGLRIVTTLALALALARDEAVWALRGFLVAAVISLAIIGLHHLGLPDTALWASMTHHTGNKSIAIAVQFSLIAASVLVIAMERGGAIRYASLPLSALLLSIAAAMPSRTSVLVVLVTLAAACIHQWRARKLVLAAALAASVLVSGAVVLGVPSVQQRFAQGISEIQAASTGDVSEASWGVRVNMYRYTAQMVAERPLMGWGIGGWTQQWKQRVPALLAGFNMPHNDFLWMGSQAGIPGALALLALVLAGLATAWRRADLTGRLGFVAALTLLLTANVNSAMRDAALGLSLLWVVGLYLRLVSEPQDAVRLLHGPPG